MKKDFFIILLGIMILIFLLQIGGCQIFRIRDRGSLFLTSFKSDKRHISALKRLIGRKNVWKWDGQISRDKKNGIRSLWLKSVSKGGVSMHLLISADANNAVTISPYLYFDEKLKLALKKDIDGKFYLQMRGRFDSEPAFMLNLAETDGRLYLLKPDEAFLLTDNNYLNTVDMIMRSNTMAVEFPTLAESLDNEQYQEAVLFINDAKDALEASLIALNVRTYDIAA